MPIAVPHTAARTGIFRAQPLLWLIFGVYMVMAVYSLSYHEMWADELHSWNIAKGSTTFTNLIYNTRFEGHPPLWLVLLWGIARFTHNPIYVQVAQVAIAVLVVFLLLFYSRLPLLSKALIPFGYFFLFEYGVLSRNYTLGVLFGFLICIILKRAFKYKLFVYYTLLFLMSNVHLLAMLLAGSLHLFFVLLVAEKGNNKWQVIRHILPGMLVFLPAIGFIAAPSGSGATISLLISKSSVSQLAIALQAPLRAFIPIPAWWIYNFWNTQFLLSLKDQYPFLKFVIPVCSVMLLACAGYLLKENRKSVLVFVANMITTFIVSLIFSLHTERYAGYIFIGFVMALWLYCDENTVTKRNTGIINGLWIIQLMAGIFAVSKDIVLPFSNAFRVKDLVQQVPEGQQVVTDYRALNAVSTYLDKPVYCIDMQRPMSFILWNTDMVQLERYPNRYEVGVKRFFADQKRATVYMLSTGATQTLLHTDAALFSSYQVTLVDSFDRAIDKESNVYLFKIERP